MGLIIDSSVLIDLERRDAPLSILMSAVEGEQDFIGLAAITVSELLVGIYRSTSAERRVRREAYLEGILGLLPVLAFDITVARTYARLWSHLTSTGQLIGAHDLLIAATAISHEHSVLTHNLRDFNRVPDLDVRRPNL